MKVTTTKSKNSESFYITMSYINNNGKSTSKTIRKLGTLKELSQQLSLDRDGVLAWAKEQAKTVLIPFHADSPLDYHQQKLFKGGYLFPQAIYYQLGFERICRKIREKHHFHYDINVILSDLIYTRILEPSSKRAFYRAAMEFLEPPSYQEHDIYRALDVLAEECDMIQAKVYKNSNFVTKRMDGILYYDCTNYYFEIEQADGDKQYGKIFPGNQNEHKSLKPLEQKVLTDFGHDKFIYCCDAGLGAETNRKLNHMGKRAFIVTQSIKKLPKEDREWALDPKGFKRLTDDKPVDRNQPEEEDAGHVLYKDAPYTTKKMDQRLIITYSPKYAAFQKEIRARQVERAQKMIASGKRKTERRNPNAQARFVGKLAVTQDGEKAKIHYYLNDGVSIANLDKLC